MGLTYDDLLVEQKKYNQKVETAAKQIAPKNASVTSASSKTPSSSVSSKPYAQQLIESNLSPYKVVSNNVKSGFVTPTVKPNISAPVTPITTTSKNTTNYFSDGYDFGDITRTLFSSVKSNVSDGYDIGDITKSILGTIKTTGTAISTSINTPKTTVTTSKSSFDSSLVSKYSSMSYSQIENEYERVKNEISSLKSTYGGKLTNYLTKLGATLSFGSNQSVDALSAIGQSQENIDKLNDLTRELEIISMFKKEKATEEYLGELSDEQLKLLDNIAEAEALEDAAPLSILAPQGGMDAVTYNKITEAEREAGKEARNKLLEQLKAENPGMSNDELNERVDEMVELRKSQRNAEETVSMEESMSEFATEHPVASFLLSRGASVLGGVTGLYEVYAQRGNEYGIDTNAPGFAFTNASAKIDEQVQLDHDWKVGGVDAFDLFYEAGTGIVDNVARLAVSGGNTAVAGAMMFPQITTQSIIEGKKKGYSDSKALALGLLDGTFEAISEKLSLDAILGSKGGVLKTLAKSFAAEGSEEVTSNWLNRIADEVANGNHSELSKKYEELLSKGYSESKALAETVLSAVGEDAKAFVMGGIAGTVLGGGNIAFNAVSNVAQKNAPVELDEKSQKVVDKVVEIRVEQEKQKGNKVTKSTKNKIRNEVIRDLDKGYLDKDSIYSEFGGEDYESYKKAKDLSDDSIAKGNQVIKNLQKERNRLQKEYDALYKMKNGEKSDEQIDRQNTLKERIAEIDGRIDQTESIIENLGKDERLTELKDKLDANVSEVVKDSKLAETFLESDRGKQSFSADTEQYKDEFAKKTVQNAIDYGVNTEYGFNNTNAAHDFVDFAAKIASDKKVEIVFTNTEGLTKLKEGKNEYNIKADPNQINAFISEEHKKMFINMDTNKSLQSLVGHEITHTTEKAKSYDDVADLVKSVLGEEEFNKLVEKKTEAYKGLNLKKDAIEKEVVADFIGDRLFTDYDFVKRLSVENRNIFQQIWDEIKYLCKLATAGSKEARQLEKVKHQFEKAYKESAKSGAKSEGVKHSLSDSEGKQLSKEQSEYFKDSQVRWGDELMPVYHGTREEFTEFDSTNATERNRQGGLLWAAKDYEYAKEYSFSDAPIVKKGYLNATNILDIGDIDSYGNYDKRLQEIADLVQLTPSELEAMVDFKHPYIYDITSSKKFKERIVELGYDGVEAQESGLQTFGFVNSNQFKNVDNLNPTYNPDIRYSLSETDNKYLSAVESGDTETAQKLVDEVAKKNGYTIKAYHGTPNNDFTVFDKGRVGKGIDQYGAGFYFATNSEAARGYGNRVIDSTLSIKNPLKIDASSEDGANLIDGGFDHLLTEKQAYEVIKRLPNIYDSEESILGDYYDTYWETGAEDWMIRDLASNESYRNIGYLDSDLFRDYPNELHEALRDVVGYDGVEVTFENGDKFYVAWFDNQMKSAEAITYDDNGNVIPLSERFNSENNDIRYSLSTEKTPQAKSRKTTKPTNSNLQKDMYSVRDVRNKTMLENGYTQADVDQVNSFMDNLATFMEKAGVTYKFVGLEDVNNAKVKVIYDNDGTPKRITMSAMVKNGEYPVNFDFTTICKKRQSMSMVIEELARRKNGDGVRELDEIDLDAKALWTINEELRKAGLETACLGCFVESKRYNIQNFANKATTMWNSVVDEIRQEQGKTEPVGSFNFAEGVDLDKVNYSKVDKIFKAYRDVKGRTSPEKRMRALIQNGGEVYQKYLQPSDLMTPEGIEGLKSLSTNKNDFYGIIKGVYGQAAPKEVMSFSPYNSEIALLPDKKGKKMKMAEYIASIGGVRMQSFSDFIVSNVYDYMQMVADLSAKHLPAHAYTKEIAFAKIFGKTGIKINMSVMFDIDPSLPAEYAGLQFVPDVNGSEEYNGVKGRFEYLVADKARSEKVLAETGERPYVQSIGFDEAVELQNTEGYSGNIGIIGVGYSDNHIRKMLNDNNIRYVIPYHSSSLPAEIKSVTNISKATDYTDYQNTKSSSGDSLPGLGGFNIYKDVAKTNDPKQTAQNYLDYCKSKNYTPVFPMFSKEENYYKLLFDFDPYDTITGKYSPQTEVKNIYDGYNPAEGLTSTEQIEKLIDEEMKAQNEANKERNTKISDVVDSVLEQLGVENNKVGFSLSSEGETPQQYGNFNTYAKDITLQRDIAPTAEAQPVAENATAAEQTAPIQENVAPMADDNIAPVQQTTPETEQVEPMSETEKLRLTLAASPRFTKYAEKAYDSLATKKSELSEEYEVNKAEFEYNKERVKDKNEFFKTEALGLYVELKNLKKGVKASDDLGYLLDYGYDWAELKSTLLKVSRNPDKVLNPDSSIENVVRDHLNQRFETLSAYSVEDLEADYNRQVEELETITKRYIDGFLDTLVRESQERRAEEKILGDSQIGTKAPVKKDNNFVSDIARNFISKDSVFETLALKKKNRALEDKLKLWRSRSGAMSEYFMKNGKGDVPSLKSIVDKVNKAGLSDEFDLYLKHRHNTSRAYFDKPIFGYDVTGEMSLQTAAELQKQHPEFKEWAKDVYKYNDYLLQKTVEGGLISAEFANELSKKYPNYVPIERILDGSIKESSDGISVGNPIKTATGGESATDNVLKAMAHRTRQVFNAVNKNAFGVELMNTLVGDVESASANTFDVLNGLAEMDDALLQPGKGGNKPTFTVFEYGKAKTFEITNDMYKALQPTSEALSDSYSKPSKNDSFKTKALYVLRKAPGAASNLHKKLITEYNLAFTMRNAPKDAQEVFFNSHHAAKTYANMPVAFGELLKGKGKYVDEYWENGGKSITYFEGRENDFVKDKNAIRKVLGYPLEAVSKINEFVETIPRLAEYIASRKSGATIEASMLDAARVTTDFSDGGDITKFFNRNGATFLNASVQGASQHIRNFRQAKAEGATAVMKLVGKYALSGLPVLLFNSFLWDEDEDYQDLSDYVKDNYYVIAKYDDRQFVRIPKGRTAAVIQEATEQVADLIANEDTDWDDIKTSFEAVKESFFTNIAPNNLFTDNVIAPLKQAYDDKAWYGESIVPSSLKDVEAREQFDESTDSISKWLGEKTGISPYKINYVLNQYSGFVGDIFLPMLTPEAERGDSSLMGNLLAPLKDQFVVDGVIKNRNPSEFYILKDELNGKAISKNATAEDKIKYEYIKSIGYELGELYNERREIHNSNLPDDVKFKQVREVQDKINQMAKEALETYENVEVDGNFATANGTPYKYVAEDDRWYTLYDNEIEDMNASTEILGITPGEYWSDKDYYKMAALNPEKLAILEENGISTKEYFDEIADLRYYYDDDYAWAANNPDRYVASKFVSSMSTSDFRNMLSELWSIEADPDGKGGTVYGTQKTNREAYIWSLDIPDEEKVVIHKWQYPYEDDYNDIVLDYINSRSDIPWEQKKLLLEEMEFMVSDDGYVSW